jgi:predicted HAD superfamily phosphohydrolase YqeG
MEIKSRAVYLYRDIQDYHKKTVIFDLDETLVHCLKRRQDGENCTKIMFQTEAGANAIAPI